MKPLPTHPITFEEFLDWCDSETRAEWVNGKVVLLSPGSITHQRIVKFLIVTLGEYVAQRKLGEIVHDFLMHLQTVQRGRLPDILFVPRRETDRFQHTYLAGPAELAVEVVSPESVTRDREEKMREYAEAGIREYWLIDPLQNTAAFYERGTDGRYRLIPLGDDGVFRSRVVEGFFLRPEWLWQTTVLDPLDVRRELGIK